MEFNLTLKSSREPASTTEDGTWFHSLMDLGKKECWSVSFLALICLSLYGFLLFWSPLLCNSWLAQWQSVDGGSCSTLQGIVSIVFAGGIPIEDFRAYVVCFYTPTLNKICICICLAGLLHSLESCPGSSYRQSELPTFVLALCLLWW